MKKKILIYGSTVVTATIARSLLKEGYHLVGHIRSKDPTFPGLMPIPEVSEDTEHDIKLSIQYDRKIENIHNAYNIHTGLLPEFGGCNILYQTVRTGAKEQGLTFHRLTEDFDAGAIISKITYPVNSHDRVVDLYKKMLRLAPLFALNCMHLLNEVGHTETPKIYFRSDIPEERSKEDVYMIEQWLYNNVSL